MRIKSIGKAAGWTAFFVLFLNLAFIQFTIPLVFACRFVNPPVTSVMVYRAFFYRWPIEKVRFIPLKKIPLQTRRMVLKVEDGDFYAHHGIEPAAMKNAWKVNKALGKPVYGGSTITMQTARTLFLVPEKSYLRKYLEVIIALEMERILGKNRIFELYLNYAEWGKGVFGIEAASRRHFGTGVRNLMVDQSVRLVTLLSSPVKYGPYTIQKNGILRSRYNYLVQRFE
jgi:monofunctional glycosyltransferase